MTSESRKTIVAADIDLNIVHYVVDDFCASDEWSQQHSTIHRYFIENPNNNHGDLCETLQSSATSKIERLQPGGEQRPTRQTDDSAACLCVCEQAGSSRKFLLRSANVLRRHWPVHQASRLGAEKLAGSVAAAAAASPAARLASEELIP